MVNICSKCNILTKQTCIKLVKSLIGNSAICLPIVPFCNIAKNLPIKLVKQACIKIAKRLSGNVAICLQKRPIRSIAKSLPQWSYCKVAMQLFCGLHTRLFVEYMATMYGDLFASFTQGFLEDHLATLQCNYIEALMQSCLVSIEQHCNVTFLQPFYKVFREAYGNVARKPVCNTNAKLQKGFPAWLPLNLYAMKMQPYGKKLQPFRNLNFPLGKSAGGPP